MRPFRTGLFSSLQFRLALGFVFALAVALALIGLAAGVVAGKQAQRFDRDRNSAEAARVQQYVSQYYDDDGDWNTYRTRLQEMLERAGSVTGSRIVLYDRQGSVVADSHPGHPVAPEFDGKRGVGRWRGAAKFPVFHDRKEVGAFSLSSIIPSGGAAPGFDGPTAGRISSEVNRSLFWAGLGAAVVGTLLIWLLSRRTLAPLQSLGEAARRLGRGDLSQRAEATGPAEIQQLAQNFNAMATELEAAEHQRRNLTADVAHELRTPLSNIQGYLEAMRDGLIQPTPETIDTIHGQALHLSRLVEDLRLLSQVESGDLRLRMAPVQIDRLLSSSVEAVRPRAEAKGVALGLEVDSSVPPVELDATRIAQVIGNLLENAITHTPEGGIVSIAARVESAPFASVAVVVSDTGPGISAEDLPWLFDRFYRADPSRSRETGGTGLGLTIARRLAEAHGGTIEVDSVVGEGSRFVVRLPLGS